MRERQHLLRSLRRALDRLNHGDQAASVTDPTDDDLRAAAEHERASHDAVRRLREERRRRCRDLAVGSALVSAAEALGLRRTETHGLLDWRRLSWPITVFAGPEREDPSIRFGRS